MLQKLHLKEFFQKLTEGIGDLIGNKTAEEITSVDKTKTKGKEKKMKQMKYKNFLYIQKNVKKY